MKKETIDHFEKELTPGGLTDFIFHLISGEDGEKLFEVESLIDGSAALVTKGTAPITERRVQFLKIYDGCKKIADTIKKDMGWKNES